MIFPFLNGIASFTKAPITWCLVFLNIWVMMFSSGSLSFSRDDFDFNDEYFLATQGRVYSQYIEKYPARHSELLRRVSKKSISGNSDSVHILGSLAMRSEGFLRDGVDLDYEGDQVAIENWRKKIKNIKLQQDTHPSFIFGLNAEDVSLSKWLSYIFIHGGVVHLVGNMLFLLLFGSILEPLLGGLAVLSIFIASGVFAGGFFLLLTGATSAPLVGASGAVSALMSLFCFLYWRRPVPFMYFLLPARGYSGYLYLPAWVILILWCASDLAGYWGSLKDIGGVAYTAHLGGELAGLIVGGTIFLLRYRKPNRWQQVEGSPLVGTMIPFVPEGDERIIYPVMPDETPKTKKVS